MLVVLHVGHARTKITVVHEDRRVTGYHIRVDVGDGEAIGRAAGPGPDCPATGSQFRSRTGDPQLP